MKYIWLWILILGCGLQVQAQQEHLWSVGVKPAYLISHRSDMKNLESHVWGAEVSYDWHNQGSWTAYYKQPMSGVSLSFFHLGKKESGQAIGILPHMQFGLTDLGSWKLQVRLGAGVGYLTKIFEPIDNRRNLAIGSHLNAYLQTSLLMHRDLDHSAWDAGLCLSHFSNAAFDAPNLGYNIPSFFLRYSFHGRQAYKDMLRPGKDTGFLRTWRSMVGILGGSKERSFSRPTRFFPYGLSYRMLRTANPIRTWRVGLDLMSDKTYAYQNNLNRLVEDPPLEDRLELGLAAGHDWRAGQLHFMLEAGVYLYRPYPFNKPMYQRMGFEYELNSHWRMRATLKFHRGVADYMEWGVNYAWNAN